MIPREKKMGREWTSMKLRPREERAFIIVVTVERPPMNSLVWARMVSPWWNETRRMRMGMGMRKGMRTKMSMMMMRMGIDEDGD